MKSATLNLNISEINSMLSNTKSHNRTEPESEASRGPNNEINVASSKIIGPSKPHLF